MELINYIDPPNRPMDAIYRPTQGPKTHQNILFIDVDEKENILVGSTNVTAPFWEGSVQLFNTYQACEENKCNYYHNSSIIYDGRLVIGGNAIVVADGNYHLNVLSIPCSDDDAHPIWRDRKQHCDKVKCLDVFSGKEESKLLSNGTEYITLWDLWNNSSLQKIHDYVDYHTREVTSTAFNKHDANVFASSGLDRRAVIWDARIETPASVLYMNEFCGLTSVAWSNQHSNILAVGSEAGDVYLLDMQQPKEFLSVQHCYKQPIHRMKFNETGYLAICGNTNEIQVYNSKAKEFEPVDKIHKHTQYVRGLAWLENTLYSCGFDKMIYKHEF